MSPSKWIPLVLLHSVYCQQTKAPDPEGKPSLHVTARGTVHVTELFLAMLLFRKKAETRCVSWWETLPSDL